MGQKVRKDLAGRGLGGLSYVSRGLSYVSRQDVCGTAVVLRLTGAGDLLPRWLICTAGKLMLAVGRRTQFLTTWTSP